MLQCAVSILSNLPVSLLTVATAEIMLPSPWQSAHRHTFQIDNLTARLLRFSTVPELIADHGEGKDRSGYAQVPRHEGVKVSEMNLNTFTTSARLGRDFQFHALATFTPQETADKTWWWSSHVSSLNWRRSFRCPLRGTVVVTYVTHKTPCRDTPTYWAALVVTYITHKTPCRDTPTYWAALVVTYTTHKTPCRDTPTYWAALVVTYTTHKTTCRHTPTYWAALFVTYTTHKTTCRDTRTYWAALVVTYTTHKTPCRDTPTYWAALCQLLGVVSSYSSWR